MKININLKDITYILGGKCNIRNSYAKNSFKLYTDSKSRKIFI